MLIGVEQIHDMHGLGEMGLDDGAIVTRSIGERDDLLGLVQSPAQRLGVHAPAKESAGFDGSDISGRVWIALGVALLIQPYLRKDATQLGFARTGRTVGLLASPSNQFILTHRDTGTVKAHIEVGLRVQRRRADGTGLEKLFLLVRE